MKKIEDNERPYNNVDKIHKEVIEKIKIKDKNIGHKLHNLKRFRVDADYKLNARVDLGKAKICTGLSQVIIDLTAELKI